jgi:hypothetical protein
MSLVSISGSRAARAGTKPAGIWNAICRGRRTRSVVGLDASGAVVMRRKVRFCWSEGWSRRRASGSSSSSWPC